MYEFIVLHLYCKFKQHLLVLAKIFSMFYVKLLPTVYGKQLRHIGSALFLCLYRRKSSAPAQFAANNYPLVIQQKSLTQTVNQTGT